MSFIITLQVIGLEDELARIREENDMGKDVYKEKTEKLAKRLLLMKKRYESLEKRRGLEVEGFKNDIKILRTRLKDVEKQLFKVDIYRTKQISIEPYGMLERMIDWVLSSSWNQITRIFTWPL